MTNTSAAVKRIERANAFVLVGSIFAMVIAAPRARSDGYAVVWQPGTGVQWAHAGMSYADFSARDGAYFGQGLRVKSFARPAPASGGSRGSYTATVKVCNPNC